MCSLACAPQSGATHVRRTNILNNPVVCVRSQTDYIHYSPQECHARLGTPSGLLSEPRLVLIPSWKLICGPLGHGQQTDSHYPTIDASLFEFEFVPILRSICRERYVPPRVRPGFQERRARYINSRDMCAAPGSPSLHVEWSGVL